jgi:hypothetical protein
MGWQSIWKAVPVCPSERNLSYPLFLVVDYEAMLRPCFNRGNSLLRVESGKVIGFYWYQRGRQAGIFKLQRR